MTRFSNIRVQTTPNGFIEFEYEGLPEEAITEHNRILRLYQQPVEGLGHTEWNKALDKFLGENGVDIATYESMSEYQRSIINELKKAFKRLSKYGV